MKDQFQSEAEEIYQEAKALVDYFWDMVFDKSKDDQFGLLGVRIRRREIGLSVEWYNAFYAGPTNQKKQYKKYIAKGKGHTYGEASLKKHKQRRTWEIELIDELEPKFSQLRRRSEALTNASKAWKNYLRVKDITGSKSQ